MPGTTIILTPVTAPSSESASGHLPQITAYDLVDRLLSYLGGNPDKAAHNDVRRAILDAYRELLNCHKWTTFIQAGRVYLNASYATGTITYDHTGGTYERMLTLTDGTWPSWAARGFLRISSRVSFVDRRISDTIITLDAAVNPGEDVDAGSEYTLQQDAYELPADFLSSDVQLAELNWGQMTYMSPSEWLSTNRYMQTPGGPARFYTFMSDVKNRGKLCLRVYPAPSEFQTVDFLYRKRARAIETWLKNDGSAAVSASTNIVTLSGAADLTDRHVGSIIRFSADTTAPTALEGVNPYVWEREIRAISAADMATLDEDVPDQLTAVAYTISDPLDVEPQSMFQALYTGALKHLCKARNRPELETLKTDWLMDLNMAKEADMRETGVQVAGLWGRYRQRLRDMPRGADIS